MVMTWSSFMPFIHLKVNWQRIYGLKWPKKNAGIHQIQASVQKLCMVPDLYDGNAWYISHGPPARTGDRWNAWADLLTLQQGIVICKVHTPELCHQFAKQTVKPSPALSKFRASCWAAFIALLGYMQPWVPWAGYTWLEESPSSASQAL